MVKLKRYSVKSGLYTYRDNQKISGDKKTTIKTACNLKIEKSRNLKLNLYEKFIFIVNI